MNKKIEVLNFSDNKYERMTCEIQFLNEPIAQVNIDKGDDDIEIELFVDFNDPSFTVKLPIDDFIEALELAKKTLKKP